MKKWIWLLLGVILTLCTVAAYKAYPYYRLYQLKNSRALQLKKKQFTTIYIPSKASTQIVIDLLQSKKLLRDASGFQIFAKVKRYRGKNIVPGKYRLNGKMTYNALLNHLRAGNGRIPIKISFHYVKNLDDLALKVSSQIEATEEELRAALNDPKTRRRYGFNKKTFPTMFLTDTYHSNWALNAKQFIAMMAKAYKKYWSGKNKRLAQKLKLKPSEVSILASIVQAEQSKKLDEWPKIAGLYLNRLRIKMKLEADPTVKFANNKPNLRRVLYKHLKVDSPYNTYKYHGLPPGPLRIPEKKAIDAVLHYQRHKYLFMCAKPEYSGYHNFSTNEKQHRRYAKLYHRWLKKEGIR